MVGVIWVIQLVHYPSFHFINKKDYEQFQDFHMKRITYIVMPTMLIELLTGVYLILSGLGAEITFIISMVLLGLIWLQTAIFFLEFTKS